MKKIVLSIGSYDGVHRGHQQIIDKMREVSTLKKIESCIIFFEIPPKIYLKSELKNVLITLPKERELLLKEQGINITVPLEFNSEIHLMRPDDFFRKFVFNCYNVSDIVVGKDFAVGYKREGDLKWLLDLSKKRKFNLFVVDFIKYENHKISSSFIRDMLKKGMVEQASELLGRNYSVSGIVKKGAGIGRKLGYPTANLDVDERKILPPGVFVVEACVKGNYFNGVASVGRRPTLKTLEQMMMCEVHLLNFNKYIYGETIKVSFIHRIRDEIKFDNIDMLVKQIRKDVDYTKHYFRDKKWTKNC